MQRKNSLEKVVNDLEIQFHLKDLTHKIDYLLEINAFMMDLSHDLIDLMADDTPSLLQHAIALQKIVSKYHASPHNE